MKKYKYVLVYPPERLDCTHSGAESLKCKLSVESSADTENQTVTIGIWDLGAWLGLLSDLTGELNNVQDSFVFFEIKAPVPSGMISRPKGMIAWLTRKLGREPEQDEISQIKSNLIADDFFRLSEPICRELSIDYLIGITPSMVAGVDGNDVYWNHFSSCSKQSILASSYQLREYAQSTGLSFSSLLMSIILPQLLTAMYWPRLCFHEDRGCLFDYDANRLLITYKAKRFFIEQSCLDLIEEPYRSSVIDILAYFNRQNKR